MNQATFRDRDQELIARLDRIPVWPYTLVLLWVVGFGYFISFYDITNVAFGLPVIAKTFHLSSTSSTIPITMSLVGYIVGAFLNSTFADAKGRKMAILSATALFTLGSVMSFFTMNLTWLIVWRFVTGMGIGAEIAAISAYMGELTPATIRGRYTSIANIFSFSGLGAVPFIALVFVPNFSWGWRMMFLIGAVGGLTMLFAKRMPESPRWLISKGRADEAETIVREAEARSRKKLNSPLPEPAKVAPEDHTQEFSLWLLLRPPFVGRLVLLLVLWFVIYLGDYTWLGLAPTLLVDKGLTLSKSIVFLVVTGVGYPIGTILASWLGDRFERKYSVLSGLLIYAVGFFLLGVAPSNATIIIFGFILSTALAFFFPLMYALTAESFPTGARASGIALTDGIGHLGGALGPILAVAIYSWGPVMNGFTSAFVYMGITGVVSAALVTMTVRATRRSLGEVSHLTPHTAPVEEL